MSPDRANLLLAHQIQSDMSCLQQIIRNTKTKNSVHLSAHVHKKPEGVEFNPRDWFKIVNDTDCLILKFRDQVRQLEARLPPAAPIGIRLTVQRTRKSIDDELAEFHSNMEKSRLALTKRMNDPLRTQT